MPVAQDVGSDTVLCADELSLGQNLLLLIAATSDVVASGKPPELGVVFGTNHDSAFPIVKQEPKHECVFGNHIHLAGLRVLPRALGDNAITFVEVYPFRNFTWGKIDAREQAVERLTCSRIYSR